MTGSYTWDNFVAPFVLTGLPSHFAVRIRFSVYLWRWTHDTYIYPLRYSIDEKGYTYNQTLDKYWSTYDIITSGLQDHTNTQVSISFRLLSSAFPYNSACDFGVMDGNCYCSTCNIINPYCCGGRTCCDQRYIRVNDLLVFASLCPTGCLNCTSTTYCIICDFSLGYYLYRAG